MEKTKRPGSDKRIPIFYFIIVCVILVAVAVAITYFSVINSFGSKENYDAAVRYSELEGLIIDKYIGEADPQSLFDAAASSMVKSLDDKWSYYMSPEQYAAYKLTSSNEYAGIGASIRINDSGKVEITDVANGTPAASAGLRAGELILSVDGTEVAGMALEEVSELIRSKLDKDFKLVVDDDGSEKTVTVSCEIIYRSPVTSRLIDKHVGYVKIVNFEAGASSEAKAAIEKLIDSGADSFIFDLRSNPGGLLSELIPLLDYILPEGDLFVSVDRDGNESVETSDKLSLKNRMVVLVNANTYSAAEFFAAALQEYDWATVIGEHTTGKARSQVTLELSDGGALHISTRKYLTPNRVDLGEVGGVTPDIAVTKSSTEADAFIEAALKVIG